MHQPGAQTLALLTNPESTYTSPREPKLVFQCYGNQRFLSGIDETSLTSRDIPPSSREKELEKAVIQGRQTKTKMALAAR